MSSAISCVGAHPLVAKGWSNGMNIHNTRRSAPSSSDQLIVLCPPRHIALPRLRLTLPKIHFHSAGFPSPFPLSSYYPPAGAAAVSGYGRGSRRHRRQELGRAALKGGRDRILAGCIRAAKSRVASAGVLLGTRANLSTSMVK
jgi:hypothetical protein